MVAHEHTATGMRFTLNGELARFLKDLVDDLETERARADAAEARAEALAAEVIRLRQENERLSQRVENLREALGDMLDDCEPDRPGAPRLSIREAARAALEDDA